MLLTDEEVQARIESPMNLLNRLRNASRSNSPCLPQPTAAELIPNLDERIGPDIKKQAQGIMSDALKELKMRLPDVQKPEKLAQIAAEMNKVLVSREDRDKDSKAPQFVIYAPQVIQESFFGETIVLQEDAK